MKTKNKAFTLAETLVVMGIIGVIAALTIPNLSQSTGNKERITKVKKLHSQINEAYNRAQAIYGPVDEWFTSDMSNIDKTTRLANRLTEFMKLQKNCGINNGVCSGLDSWNTNTERYLVLTADGTSLQIFVNPNNDKPSANFDVDGAKPHKAVCGKNIFCGMLDAVDGFRPMLYSNISDYIASMKSDGDRYAAFKWVLENDNMDYLKIDADWKCPNGKVLNLSANPPVTSCN